MVWNAPLNSEAERSILNLSQKARSQEGDAWGVPIDGEGASCIPILAAFTIDLLRFEVNFSCLLFGFQQKRQHFGVTVDFGFA